MTWLRSLYDWTMDKAVHPQAVWWLAFFCFIEASFFPIPPHPLLALMCLAEPRKAIWFAFVATIASVAGAILGYGIGWGLYDTVGVHLIAALGLTDDFPTAACYLKEYDWEAILIAGATPVPFKLLTLSAGFINMNFITFIAAGLVARALIFMSVGVLFRVFGARIKNIIDRYLGTVATLFVTLVVGGFVVLGQFPNDQTISTDFCVNT